MTLVTPDFKIAVEDIDERAVEHKVLSEGGNFEDVQKALARQKAKAVYDALSDDEKQNSAVIGADTSVILGDKILGKPEDKSEAREMLTALSGRSHKVITGVCVMTMSSVEVFTETTEVTFGDSDEYQKALIERYINTDEPYDKAGAYGIQEGGGLLVKSIDGDYFNVVGLPVRPLSIALSKLGI